MVIYEGATSILVKTELLHRRIICKKKYFNQFRLHTVFYRLRRDILHNNGSPPVAAFGKTVTISATVTAIVSIIRAVVIYRRHISSLQPTQHVHREYKRSTWPPHYRYRDLIYQLAASRKYVRIDSSDKFDRIESSPHQTKTIFSPFVILTDGY